jgi:hypothetical protein
VHQGKTESVKRGRGGKEKVNYLKETDTHKSEVAAVLVVRTAGEEERVQRAVNDCVYAVGKDGWEVEVGEGGEETAVNHSSKLGKV